MLQFVSTFVELPKIHAITIKLFDLLRSVNAFYRLHFTGTVNTLKGVFNRGMYTLFLPASLRCGP